MLHREFGRTDGKRRGSNDVAPSHEKLWRNGNNVKFPISGNSAGQGSELAADFAASSLYTIEDPSTEGKFALTAHPLLLEDKISYRQR